MWRKYSIKQFSNFLTVAQTMGGLGFQSSHFAAGICTSKPDTKLPVTASGMQQKLWLEVKWRLGEGLTLVGD